MKKFLVVLLSFMFSLPVFNFSLNVNLNEKSQSGIAVGISKVFAVQYDLYKQTKNIVINISNHIIKDITLLSAASKKNNLFIDNQKIFISNLNNNYFNTLKVAFLNNSKQSLYSNSLIQINLFVLIFVFIFLIRYLGLLRIFWSVTITSYRKKEACKI